MDWPKKHAGWVYFEVGWFTSNLGTIETMAHAGHGPSVGLLTAWQIYWHLPDELKNLGAWAMTIRHYRTSCEAPLRHALIRFTEMGGKRA